MPATALDPKTALVVIDLQMGLSTRPLMRPFAEIVAQTARLAAAFRAASLPVVLVNVGLSPDGGDAPGRRTEVRISLPTDPEFSRLAPELAIAPNDLRVTKKQPNAFYGTDLDLQLRRRNVTGIVLAGIVTSNGVDTTARGAFERSYNVTFAADAMTDVDPEAHEHVLKKVFPRLGEIDTTEAILALLAKR